MSFSDLVCQTSLDLLRKRIGATLKKKKKVKLFFNLVLFMNLMQNSAVSGYWLYCFLQTGING